MNDLYPEEILIYQKLLEAKNLGKILVDLQVASNPYSERPGDLFKSVQRMHDELISDLEPLIEELDREGLARLKSKLSSTSNLIKVIPPKEG